MSKLESNLDIENDEIINLTNFIQNSLRASMFEIPQNEKIVQNTLESLFLGIGMSKGNDYKRESGRVDYSSKQFIPDFNLDSLSLAIEVKLIKKIADRSKVIDEINADIPAYQTKYDNIIFVVYDLGIIRNIEEFKADIENNIGIQVIVIKH
ncbi:MULTISPECIES: hypothetical protein [unclassified Enterococcus]|uniref:PD-(D/E)XK nuclease domain-containing protein n=1 Tax=unclassified Enterococcus TaxID=2608891 RepID=UPI001907DB99|nr:MULTISPECIES: hypothetical protein [unclassified Enterococcus]MBK0038803.1 hypothetical protein [Enterococcus sp. S52]MBK0071796.1 hypothetical protein [Enterococcus sp. S53]MBK0142081.1 hypothetical protein [Enterococcus sp. S76]MBK0145776.1 hypothetical protein [Enterococcus sp. S77]